MTGHQTSGNGIEAVAAQTRHYNRAFPLNCSGPPPSDCHLGLALVGCWVIMGELLASLMQLPVGTGWRHIIRFLLSGTK